MVARTGELRKLGIAVVIWDHDAIQHEAIDDYGNEPCTIRRVTAPDAGARRHVVLERGKEMRRVRPIEGFDVRDERFHR